MNFEALRKEISGAAPSMESLQALGISNKRSEKIVSSFNLVPRIGVALITSGSNVIENFFNLYDPSNLIVGMIRFLAIPTITDAGWIIGSVEADPLLVDKFTEKVYVDDLTSPGRPLWNCSDTAEHFLLALAPAAQYLGLCFVDEAASKSTVLKRQFLEKCVVNAGGESYESFYRMLLGVE